MEKETRIKIEEKGLLDILHTAEAPLLDDKEIKRVDIIVLKYKSPDLEQECISNIIKHTEWPYKITVFDNRGNGPNTAKIWNKLIKESTCDYVLLIDSDAFVQSAVNTPSGMCWLTALMQAFDKYDNVAIVGPVCGTNTTSVIQRDLPIDVDPESINNHLSGYCFLTKKSIYDKIGYFDEDFCFYGQESDWIERIMELNSGDNNNYAIVVVRRSYVVHGKGNSSSIAAIQADKEGEIDIMRESEYSRMLAEEKKRLRAAVKSKSRK